MPDDVYQRLTVHAESIGKQLNQYISYLKRSKQGEKDFPAGYSVKEESEPYILNNPEEDTAN